MPGFSARPPGCCVKGSAAPVSLLRRLLRECEWSAHAAAALDNGPAIARDEACRESEAFSSFMRASAEPMPPFCPAIARLADTRILLARRCRHFIAQQCNQFFPSGRVGRLLLDQRADARCDGCAPAASSCWP